MACRVLSELTAVLWLLMKTVPRETHLKEEGALTRRRRPESEGTMPCLGRVLHREGSVSHCATPATFLKV